ncbi:MAG: hypothetical protein IPK80_35340 [Nannocystis sp.]|nr:hypothetical protein [Nannocystis sp.]
MTRGQGVMTRGAGLRFSRRWLGGMVAGLVASLVGAACSGGGGATAGDTGGSQCLEAIVFDIDETLTISDAEWEMQKADGTYDPVERAAASEMVSAYADRGYQIIYLTARSQTWVLGGTGESSTDATRRWLEEHGFPLDPASSRIILSKTLVSGDTAIAYKAGALADMQAEGLVFDGAYGNATTDIAAFAQAKIPKDVTFIIGVHAGEEGTVAIAGEGWQAHLDTYVSSVNGACAAP